MTPSTSLPALPQPAAQPVPTLADARVAISQWDLKPQHRKNLRSAASGLAIICGLPENGVELTCENLNALLFRKPPSAWGFTPQRFGQICSGARTIMRRMERHAPELPGYAGLSDAWKALHDSIPPAGPTSKSNYRQIALITFMGFCSTSGVEPADVDEGTLSAFEAYLRTDTICADVPERVRKAASNWHWARQHIEGWPTTELRRQGMRRQYTFPLEQYPASFQADAVLFLERLAGDDEFELFDDDVISGQIPSRARSPLKPATIARHQDQIRRAAAVLILEKVVDFKDLQTLRDLVHPLDRVKTIRKFLRDRLGKGRNGLVTQTLETLIMIRQLHCRQPDQGPDRELEGDIKKMRGWAAVARPPSGEGMSEKNQIRLKALTQPRPRAMLQHLPEELLLRARRESLTPIAAARLAAYAIALEILLVFPMRRGNLAGLRLDKHLQWLNGRRQPVSHIFLSQAETKNGVAMQWPLPVETSQRIELYLKHYRPTLAGPGNQYLFPGPDLKSRSAHELALGLSGLIHKELGLEINLHLMRHFAGWVYLNQHPGAYEVVRQILGHKSLRVVIDYYTGLETEAAARHFDATVLKDRAASRTVARAAFRRSRTRRGRKV